MDVGGISASVALDANDYLEKMLQIQRRTAAAVEEMATAASASQKVGQASQQAASSAGAAVGAWTELASKYAVVAQVAEKAKEAVSLAINAANEMDPKGAAEWNKNVRELQNTFLTLVGTVGQKLRPVLEQVMRTVTQVLKYIGSINFSAIWADLKSSAASALDWLKDAAYNVAVTIADIITAPFQALQNIITATIMGALNLVAGQIERFGRLLDAVGLGDKFKSLTGVDLSGMAKQLRAAADAARDVSRNLDIGKQLVDGALNLGKSIADGIVEGAKFTLNQAKGALDQYKGPEMKVQEVKVNQAAAENARYQQDLDAKVAKFGLLLTEAEIKGAEAALAVRRQGMDAETGQLMASYKQAVAMLDQAYSNHDRGAERAARLQVAAAEAALQKQSQAVLAIDNARVQEAAQTERSAWAQAAAAREAADSAIAAAREASRINAGANTEHTQKALADAQKVESIKTAAAEQAFAKAVEAEQRAGEMRKAFAADSAKITTDAAMRAAELQVKAAEQAAKARKYVQDTMLSTVTGAGGTLGSTASGIKAGFENGGEVGAIVGGIVGLLTKSKGFQELVDAINTLLDSLSNAVGKLLEGLTPLLGALTSALSPAINALGGALGAVAQGIVATLMPAMPAISALAGAVARILEALTPIITPLFIVAESFTLIMPALALLSLVVPPLAQVVDLLAMVISMATEAIANAWNWMVGKLQDFLRKFHDVPVVGEAISGLAATLDSFKVQITDAGSLAYQSMSGVASAGDAAASSLQQLAQQALSQLQTAQSAAQNAEALRRAATKAEKMAAASPNDPVLQAYAEAVRKAADDAQKQAVSALDQYRVDQAQAAVAAAAPGSQAYDDALGQLAQALAQQAYDAAQNTQATKDNTRVTQAFAESLTNIPSFYKVAQTRADVFDSQTLLPGTGSGSGGVVITGDIHISANNVDEFMAKLDEIQRRKNYRLTGTMGRLPGSRNTTAPP